MSVYTGEEIMNKFRRRKKLRELSELPIIGPVIKLINPDNMFDDPIDESTENNKED
jgi:hypothetical protein